MADWTAWQKSWDRQQEWYLPDREERFRVMLDGVEAVVGRAPRVLDLACGTGTITSRVLARFPDARTTGVDLDPALLTIARGSLGDEQRATFVSADLRSAEWTASLPHEQYDAVLTSTALHWLQSGPLRDLYRAIASVLRPGGVFVNADHMPDDTTPQLNDAFEALVRDRQEKAQADGAEDWSQWWQRAAEAPELAEAAAERFAIFGTPMDGDHSDGEAHSAEWHALALRDAGFAEARAIWASPTDGMVLGLR
nr:MULTISPECIES: class I SAM-dependent methyltransferase [Streptomyces]